MDLSANGVAGQSDEAFLDTYFTVAQGQWAMWFGADEERHLSMLNKSEILFTSASVLRVVFEQRTKITSWKLVLVI